MKPLAKLLLTLIFYSTLTSATILTSKTNFLVISDIHLDTKTTRLMEISPHGSKRSNDLDSPTFDRLISDIKKQIQKGTIAYPQFILILGDISGHFRYDSSTVWRNETAVFLKLKKTFPKIPLLYTFGNNDSMKLNYGPFSDNQRPLSIKTPYTIAKTQAQWRNGFLSTGNKCQPKASHFPCLVMEDAVNGYYVAYLQPKLRFISLNSVLFSPNRRQVSPQEASYQLNWLNKQLGFAKKQQEAVLIAMHIPPGNNIYDHSLFWLDKDQQNFLKLLKAYQNTIIGILASHTHQEELKIIKDPFNKTIGGVFYTAGLSTSHGNEPSVKTFYLAQPKGRWLLSNYTTFHFTLRDSKLIFEKLYDYRNYYCQNMIYPSLLACLNQVSLNKLRKFYTAGNPNYAGIIRAPQDLFLRFVPDKN